MKAIEIPNYTSGEFIIPALQSTCQRSVAILGNTLNIIGKGYENAGINEGWPLVHQQFDLTKLNRKKNKGKSGLELIDNVALKKKENWTKLTNENLGSSGSMAHPAITANATDMWTFYQGKIRSQSLPLIGRQFTLDDDTNDDMKVWGPPIAMKMTDGTKIEHVGAVSANYFGSDQIIIVAGGYIGMSDDYPQPHSDSVFIGIFNVDDLDDENSSWKATSSKWLSINDISYYKNALAIQIPHFKNFGKNISFDWFLNPKSLDKNTHPSYGLAVNFSCLDSSDNNKYSSTIFISLITDAKTGNVKDIDKEKPKCNLRPIKPFLGESGLMRDPAGRLRSYGYDFTDKSLKSSYCNTSKFPSPENKFESSGNQNIPNYRITPTKYSYFEYLEINLSGGYLTDYQILPTGAYYVFPYGKTSPKESTKDNPIEDYPILEFTFYNSNKCQLNYYGTIRTVSETRNYNPKQNPQGPTIIIGGIIDGPIPFPIENYVGYEISAGTDEVGSVNYKREEEKHTEKSIETSWTAGFEAEGKTSEGVGPAFKIAVEGGMGSVLKQSKGIETEHKLSVPATVESSSPFEEPEITGKGAAKVLAAEFIITGCQFIDSSNSVINDSLKNTPSVGPKSIGILTTMVGTDESYSFDTYTATAGKLESYTPEQLNARMNKLGYEGVDYFKEVVHANAFPFSEDEPYLIFKWNEGTADGSGFKAFKSSFEEQKWTFDGEFYGGISGEGGIDFFGIGEKFESSFLAGVSYSRENSKETTNKTTWGIEIEGKENWGGPPPRKFEDAPNSIKSYTFRLYFLPVPDKDSGLSPNYWTKELKKYAADGERIDPNSGSWRILYVVTLIEYNDPSKEIYDYENSNRSNVSS